MKLNATAKKYMTGGALALLLGCGAGVLNVSANSISPIMMEAGEDTVSSGTEKTDKTNRPSRDEVDFETDKEFGEMNQGMKAEGKRGGKGMNVSKLLEKLDDETKAKVLNILGVSEDELGAMDKDSLKELVSGLSEDQVSQIKELAASVFENMEGRPSRDEADFETGKRGGKGMNVSKLLEKLDDETKAKVLNILGVTEDELSAMDKDSLKELVSGLSEEQISQIKELAASVFENMGGRPSKGDREDMTDFEGEMTRPSKGGKENMTGSEGEMTRPGKGEKSENSFSGENA